MCNCHYNNRMTKGSEFLSAFFEAEARKSSGKNKQWLADECGVARTTVHYWCAGQNRPADDRLRRLVEVLTGTPVASWFTEKEAQRREAWRRKAEAAEAAREVA